MRVSTSRQTFFLFLATVLPNVLADARQRAGPSGLFLDGITNVANSATNFLNGVVQRQKDLINHVTDTATDYVVNAVEKPRSLLMNTAIMTTNYSKLLCTDISISTLTNSKKDIVDSAASIGLNYKLRRLLEKFRTRMPYGFPELGVPVLEPLQLSELYLETHNPEIGDLEIFVDKVSISGLSTFMINRARLSLIGPTIAANLTVPTVLANGNYNMSGVVGDMFNIHGAGPFSATVSNLTIIFETVLGYSRGMYMKSFDLDFSIGAVKIKLDNFMGGSKFGTVMNNVFEKLTPHALEIIKPEILPEIQEYICGRVNDTIYHLTMRDVLIFLIGENEAQKYPHLLLP